MTDDQCLSAQKRNNVNLPRAFSVRVPLKTDQKRNGDELRSLGCRLQLNKSYINPRPPPSAYTTSVLTYLLSLLFWSDDEVCCVHDISESDAPSLRTKYNNNNNVTDGHPRGVKGHVIQKTRDCSELCIHRVADMSDSFKTVLEYSPFRTFPSHVYTRSSSKVRYKPYVRAHYN